MTALKLIDGLVSPVCQIEGGFLIYEWKNVMDAHGSRLLGDISFGNPGQLLKLLDLRVSPILYTLFDQCDIQNPSDGTESDGWDIFVQFAELMAVFLFTNEKMSRMLKGAVSLKAVLLGTQDNSSLQCYSVLSTIAQVLRKMSLKILVS